ncbi:aminotransferase class V-fold PLP-dependent enzyme [Dyadobacter sandarakinus]|uniref:Aminotransferase class V-fold PLP-dependent enzyme n=1 Tax=Dyadobacter sandarakinus TaxID=2747268 RepID=A0ABX7I6M0_9BACT|nr:aminotransferase class V-fold PLP-dependent enzyme [Dyadobacter sandarakinus]QRR01122.1 aminotransferase class V-fold PLP-dependent enzyme [Dyadobacter sandarakinus]
MKRRDAIRDLSLLPLAGSAMVPKNQAPETTAAVVDSAAGKQLYQSIGVEPIINCRGTFTIIGGSIERPEVRAAMDAAAQVFVQYDELAYGAGQRLAELTGAEWGLVSSGCAAGMKHVTVACVTGGNPEKLIRVPDLTGFDKTEVIIPAYSRNVYDHSLRNVGVKIVTVETIEELRNAMSSRTAMIYLMAGSESMSGPMSLEAISKIAKPKNIPILIDAAAEDLTIPNVHLKLGADVVVYSGGKAICGPQCAGLVLGRKDLLMSAWQASAPHHGPGRDNKVGREETMGMVAAVEAWTKRDHKGEWKRWLTWLDSISKRVNAVESVKTKVIEPTDLSNRTPQLKVSWDPAKLHITGEEIAELFGRTKPRIALGGGSDEGSTFVSITTGQMQPGDEKVVADRLFEVLSQKRTPKKAEMAEATVSLKGHWEATVEFFSSASKQTLIIEQDGNWLSGTHKGELSVRELQGTVEGNEFKMRSVDRHPADWITFLFSGTVKDDTMTGSIYMGEYMTAKFTAKRYKFEMKREKIMIPSGPPLAT